MFSYRDTNRRNRCVKSQGLTWSTNLSNNPSLCIDRQKPSADKIPQSHYACSKGLGLEKC